MPGLLRLGAAAAIAFHAAAAAAQIAAPLEILPPVTEFPADAGKQIGIAQPLQFAVPVQTAFSPETSGRWVIDGARATWRLRVQSVGATSMNAGLTGVSLPAGARLSVFDPARELEHGPYTARDVAAGQLWTALVPGDTIEFELTVPHNASVPASFVISQIGHGYKNLFDGTAKSGQCNVDVVCSQGDGWRDQIRSVARYTVSGIFLCSGTLVNNIAQDLEPYFLTANHCVASNSDAMSMVFYWNFETSRCGGQPDGSLRQNQSTALFLASSTLANGDYTLVRLLNRPSPAFNVYYSGWDARDLAPNSATAIHHPNGDEKRISFEFDALSVTSLYEDTDIGDGSYLRVADWDIGTTEPGSSGSGLWNSSRHLVGTLTGGGAACGNNQPDWYGRFHKHYAAGASLFLDPANLSGGVLDGLDPEDSPFNGLRALGLLGAGNQGAGAGWPVLLALLLWRRRRAAAA